MLEAWYMYDATDGNKREELRFAPNQPVAEEQLAKLGVLHWNIPEDELEVIKKERGYKHEDVITIAPGKLPNYEEKIQGFFREHLHTDEEIRYVRDGQAYFDVRGEDDRWIRICVKKQDLLILPAGIYHRLTTDEKNFIVLRRLFVDEPVWLPYNRDEVSDKEVALKCRDKYEKSITIE